MELPEETEPCKEGDHGKFEVTDRDGWARIGILHTSTEMLDTPTLLPVVNPNILTVKPSEMWDMGFRGLITNSYVIWKHEKLKEHALSRGVHDLLDYPGVIMTDSGTFQQYIYGDVEVGEVEVVEFQRNIGVDIATMMDVFGRPDMSFEELAEAVAETARRGPAALEAAGATLLNGPIQGGTHSVLREESARLMSKMDFAVHPIGGIVPLMENQRYRELVEIIVSTKSRLTPERPVHLFGCGHPMLFPICIALGVDLFDSAAYALFAKDNRLLTPTGTVKLDGLKEWPEDSWVLRNTTPKKVREMADDERATLLARHNLAVTNSEIHRCRQAVRDGEIWHLVEERSHCNPYLREATVWLYDNLPDEIVRNTVACRVGGVQWSQDLPLQPRVVRAKSWMITSPWRPPHIDHLGRDCDYEDRRLLVFHNRQGPWRETIGQQVLEAVRRWPQLVPLIYTPIGIVPYSLEDLNPFAHIFGPDYLWDATADVGPLLLDHPNPEIIEQVVNLYPVEVPIGNIIFHDANVPLETLFEALEQSIGPADQDAMENSTIADVQDYFRRWGIADKIAIFTHLQYGAYHPAIPELEFVMSRTGRVNNVLHDGVHLFSQRLTDGGLSLTIDGAKWVHERGTNDELEWNPSMMPSVIVNSDAEPFVRQGRSVMHGFIVGTEGEPQTGTPCLVLNEAGELLGHGIARCDYTDMMAFRKGIAVKVKDGVGDAGD